MAHDALLAAFVSIAIFAVLGDPATSVNVDLLPALGEIKLANSNAIVVSPVAIVLVLPVFVEVPVFVGTGTTVLVVAGIPEPVDAAAATQGPLAVISSVPHVVSPNSPPPHAARAKPVMTKAETDAKRMMDSQYPEDSSLNLNEFR
jgi:hypothetical protein